MSGECIFWIHFHLTQHGLHASLLYFLPCQQGRPPKADNKVRPTAIANPTSQAAAEGAASTALPSPFAQHQQPACSAMDAQHMSFMSTLSSPQQPYVLHESHFLLTTTVTGRDMDMASGPCMAQQSCLYATAPGALCIQSTPTHHYLSSLQASHTSSTLLAPCKHRPLDCSSGSTMVTASSIQPPCGVGSSGMLRPTPSQCRWLAASEVSAAGAKSTTLVTAQGTPVGGDRGAAATGCAACDHTPLHALHQTDSAGALHSPFAGCPIQSQVAAVAAGASGGLLSGMPTTMTWSTPAWVHGQASEQVEMQEGGRQVDGACEAVSRAAAPVVRKVHILEPPVAHAHKPMAHCATSPALQQLDACALAHAASAALHTMDDMLRRRPGACGVAAAGLVRPLSSQLVSGWARCQQWDLGYVSICCFGHDRHKLPWWELICLAFLACPQHDTPAMYGCCMCACSQAPAIDRTNQGCHTSCGPPAPHSPATRHSHGRAHKHSTRGAALTAHSSGSVFASCRASRASSRRGTSCTGDAGRDGGVLLSAANSVGCVMDALAAALGSLSVRTAPGAAGGASGCVAGAYSSSPHAAGLRARVLKQQSWRVHMGCGHVGHGDAGRRSSSGSAERGEGSCRRSFSHNDLTQLFGQPHGRAHAGHWDALAVECEVAGGGDSREGSTDDGWLSPHHAELEAQLSGGRY